MDSRIIIEWIGVVINIVAVVLCVRKSGWCWWAGLACSGIWIWYGYDRRDLPLMINQVVMVGLNVWGIVRWHKDTGKK